MEAKPVIGVTPYLRKTEPFDAYVPQGIIDAVRALGGEVRMIDYTKLKLYELIGEAVQLDGMIFAGGVDVNPAFYGAEKEPACGEICEKRDEIELNLFPLLLTRSLPILGICRGCQVINVAFGGTLTQDISTAYGTNHYQNDADGPYHHEITIVPGTKLHGILGKTQLRVNSYHHQCVKKLAPGLTANAYAPEGFPEGFEGPEDGPFLLGLEWHPESTLQSDGDSIKPFEAFMQAVRARAQMGCHG